RSMLGVPMLSNDEVIGLLFLDGEEEQREFTDSELETVMAFAGLAATVVTQTKVAQQMQRKLRTLAIQDRARRKAASAAEELNQLILVEAVDHRVAVREVARLTNKTCMLFDESGHSLASAAPGDDEVPVPDAVCDSLGALLSTPGLAARPDRTHRDAVRMVGPHPDRGVPFRAAVAPAGRWGNLVIAELRSPISQLDLDLVGHAGRLLALQMLTEERVGESELDSRITLAGQLIRGDGDMSENVRRLRALGMAIETERWVCVIGSVRRDDAVMFDPRTVSTVCARHFGEERVLVTTADGEAVVLVDAVSSLPEMKKSLTAIVEQLDVGLLAAGISNRSQTDLATLPRAYAEALDVVRSLRRFAPPVGRPPVFAACELGPMRRLLSGARPGELEEVAVELLGPLLYPANADLLLTLSAFIEEGCRVREAAERLEVHGNTVRYRLSKAEAMIGMDIATDSDARLELRMALLILRFRSHRSLATAQ
ncbi:MAG: helix-turn-helix domain-containing protein, partial [Actinobacteria bacterium]|nr:helix-turn-helix domain-containing protein [Actinomycetota bacterium]